jgi:hypothetical protein
MLTASVLARRARTGLGIVMLAALTGSVGCGGGYYGGSVDVVAPGPFFWGGAAFGGPYYHGRDAHAFSHRGAYSRGVAHGGGGHR